MSDTFPCASQMIKRQFIELLRQVFGVKPPADALAAFELPDEVEEPQLAFYMGK